jgi:hypothetical protein
MPTVEIPYCPREAFESFHKRTQRWGVLVVHRRGGKTVAAINDLIKGALLCKRSAPRFAYLAPYRQQAKIIAWDYLKHYSAPVPGGKTSEGELYRELPNGGRVTLYGADNYEALRGIYLDGVVVDEPADVDEEVWTSILRPALADRGGWCVWIGTPKGRNSFYRLYARALADPTFFTMRLPASESHILPEHELASARQAMTEAAYNREFECSFDAAIEGAIYGEIIDKLRSQNRIADFPHEASVPTFTFWDIGMSDYGCIWFVQFHGRDILLCDYVSATGQPAAWYAGKVAEWERKNNALIRANYLPHDANTRDKGNGKTYVQSCQDAGMVRIHVVPRTPDIWLGINEVRLLLPRCCIHATNCGREELGERAPPTGIDCLEYYHRREENINGIIGEQPVHDEFSHGADALRTMGEAHRLGMIEGTSMVARENRDRPVKVLRGAGPQSYPIGGKKLGGKVLR